MSVLNHAKSSRLLFDCGAFAAQKRTLFTLCLVAAVTFTLTGCGEKKAGGAAPAAMPPAEVGVVTTSIGNVGLVSELPGRLEASRVAEVRARVSGIIQARLFKEGSDVKAEQGLFEIDAAPYSAAYRSATASLAKAEANQVQAAALVNRYQPLVEVNAISQQDFINAQASLKQAEADVAMAQANVQTAKINLDYAHVKSPISGRIGRALVTEGALVGQGESTPLAVVQQIDPMYINFTQAATEVLALRREIESGAATGATGKGVRVWVALEDGTEYALPGRLLFSDLTVDANTGQITLRAEVPNPKGELLPGLYVRARLEQAQAVNVITLPQQAVTRSEQGDSVMVVSSEGKVERRSIKISGANGTHWIVTEGLKAGEQVMVDGFQKLRGDAPVKAVPWQPLSDKAQPSTPAVAKK